jgi:hypothetical protein
MDKGGKAFFTFEKLFLITFETEITSGKWDERAGGGLVRTWICI